VEVVKLEFSKPVLGLILTGLTTLTPFPSLSHRPPKCSAFSEAVSWLLLDLEVEPEVLADCSRSLRAESGRVAAASGIDDGIRLSCMFSIPHWVWAGICAHTSP
jgi:hypothetical protein